MVLIAGTVASSNPFFDQPILNSPYLYPSRHWELAPDGTPTQQVVEKRRDSSLLTPIPQSKRQKSGQESLVFEEGLGLSTAAQQYATNEFINRVRGLVGQWRSLPNPADWQVTPDTANLLRYWRNPDNFAGIRPFFCQIEAVETAIWLTEVAPQLGRQGKAILDVIESANQGANPGILRLALKLATGAGKTTVMAMLIAWQTINAVRQPRSNRFTRGFLIVTPGITIKDRLRVLQPNDPESYYASRELVPREYLPLLDKARIVITNYHAFKLRTRVDLSKTGRALLQGRGPELATLETEGQMIQRVMPSLMGMRNVLVLNDEAHHCYRENPGKVTSLELKGEERREAEENNEAARLWLTGIETVNRHLGVARVIDLSATPFFLAGSGYAEGTLFPWTVSDFSLMDAIECGIVKLPRVPVAQNIAGSEVPVFRNLWEHIRKDMPKKGRIQGSSLDPAMLPVKLQTALEVLYGHYHQTYQLWQAADIEVPPCFIVVCNNTATSKLVYDYISGYLREDSEGTETLIKGQFELFSNYDTHGNALPRPRTLLIDSMQLESGEGLDDAFREIAAGEIEQFRRDMIERGKSAQEAANVSDADLLREVMNTVGKRGKLGESVRCVVSVSMLTEGWDTNTVTHVLGVRAFGTQLLCEQVIGRALRRQSYDLNEEGLFNVEYADVLGIPFDFTAKPVVSAPQQPRQTIHVQALPERDPLEITFPRVLGYRVDLPNERFEANFNADSTLVLNQELVGPTITTNSGIIGQGVDLSLERLSSVRPSQVCMHLTHRLLETKLQRGSGQPDFHLFGRVNPITQRWMREHLVCQGETYPALLMYQTLADMACERIAVAIIRSMEGTKPIKALLDPYSPTGSTRGVSFVTSKANRWQTRADRSHVNWAILDSDWEGQFCQVAERHPAVLAYVKNQGLNFEVPYLSGSTARRYIPDFIVLLEAGQGLAHPLHLVVEIKGYRGEDAKDKKATMENRWIPGVNNLGSLGRWAFVELTDSFTLADDFDRAVRGALEGRLPGQGS